MEDRRRGRTKKPNETRSTRIDGASAGLVENACSADAANCSSDRIQTVRLDARDETVLRSSHPPRAGPLGAIETQHHEPGQEF
jgi:hypothetical protein